MQDHSPLTTNVLNVLMAEGTSTLVELSVRCGVPLATLRAVLARLEDDGLLNWRNRTSRSGGVVVGSSRLGRSDRHQTPSSKRGGIQVPGSVVQDQGVWIGNMPVVGTGNGGSTVRSTGDSMRSPASGVEFDIPGLNVIDIEQSNQSSFGLGQDRVTFSTPPSLFRKRGGPVNGEDPIEGRDE